MSRYPNPSNAPADAKQTPPGGDAVSPFDRAALKPSSHPAIAPKTGAGGRVASVTPEWQEAAGGKIQR
jgi:hypothetical protein